MGPQYTDEEVFLAVRDRADSAQILNRLSYFSERVSEKGKEIDELRVQLANARMLDEAQQAAKVEALTKRASRLSEDISRIEAERDQYVATIIEQPAVNTDGAACRI